MSTSKLFARRLIGGRVSTDRALFRKCCKTTELVEGPSTFDSQPRIDEERSLKVDKEAIWKLCTGLACENRE